MTDTNRYKENPEYRERRLAKMRKRYNKDKEYMERRLTQVKKYHKTKKGKRAIARAIKNKNPEYEKEWRKKHPNYMKNWIRQRRVEANSQ